ncbi:hypothetical protein BO70DRAFT_432662 [Aspergillus heteromorphus CBS 117.55]|uniref:F-box domain-containing protein n=1 Tax=Aspergillus heteromorphus CBS 117.55 TaxID=1448321 RepID=A0A317V9D8_9EURO|nr:uncharacterized protein BO70DRAFT_432662 [Aspergillus heteromorphus CBS 117.55]PWY68610.1 hypothetical protein BO70DRAFT_432662 [Aspergillus heteromorphus CBS 117.55]
MDPEKPCQVFYIREILEMILLKVGMRTLLNSGQRVCRYWRELIQNSSRLQVVLFFKPSTRSLRPGRIPVLNPLINKTHFGTYFGRQSRLTEEDIIHMRPEASWKRMLIRQPPTSSVGICEFQSADPFDSMLSKVQLVPMDDVLRLGHLDLFIPPPGDLEAPDATLPTLSDYA